MNRDQISQPFLTNTAAPIVLALALAPLLRNSTGVLTFMSSRMGSVANPNGTDLALYKASKAALNSMVNTLASSWTDNAATLLCLHPGWVQTDLGADNGEIDVLTSTTGLIEQVKHYAGRGVVHFVDYTGQKIAK